MEQRAVDLLNDVLPAFWNRKGIRKILPQQGHALLPREAWVEMKNDKLVAYAKVIASRWYCKGHFGIYPGHWLAEACSQTIAFLYADLAGRQVLQRSMSIKYRFKIKKGKRVICSAKVTNKKEIGQNLLIEFAGEARVGSSLTLAATYKASVLILAKEEIAIETGNPN